MNINSIKSVSDKNTAEVIPSLKVIEYNVSDCTEHIYAVVTPVKNSDYRM